MVQKMAAGFIRENKQEMLRVLGKVEDADFYNIILNAFALFTS